MPAYGAAGYPKTLNPGDVIQLVNAADATAGTLTATVPLAILQGGASASTPQVTVVNTTGQTATAQVATSDAAANYQPLTNADTNNAITIASGKAAVFSCSGPFLRFTFASAPTTGLFTISR
jgi:hypothetical protein